MSRLRIIDLDGSLVTQEADLFDSGEATRISALDSGPKIRLACSFRRFKRFRGWLDEALPDGPGISLYGSGDFHHVTLALLARIRGPFNLLVLDKHPDWMRGIPFLHCGTWLRHALHLPNLRRVFHCGGETDFDNAYRPLAPWPEIRTGRVVVFPARRRFAIGAWSNIESRPLLEDGASPSTVLAEALHPFRDELYRIPLYVTFDKDVLTSDDASVNWDSGLLRLSEALCVLETFLDAAGHRLAGADVLGDWSPIRLANPLNRLCHRLDHPSPTHDPSDASNRNRRANAAILGALRKGFEAA